jgi:hypothetical protein
LNFLFAQNDLFIVGVLVLFVKIFQNSVKCVISLLLVLNVGVSNNIFKCFGDGLVVCFVGVMVMAAAESPGRTVVNAALVAARLQRADPSFKPVLQPHITESDDIFGVDDKRAAAAVVVPPTLEAIIMEVAVFAISRFQNFTIRAMNVHGLATELTRLEDPRSEVRAARGASINAVLYEIAIAMFV